ncbi:MAG: hypothetical protein ACJ786_38170, partial [Catenulispora sp.]
MNQAILHGLNRCVQSTSSCSFKITGTGTAYLDQHKCVPGSVVQNGTGSQQNFDVSSNILEGWQNQLGGSVTVSDQAGASIFGLLENKITVAVQVSYAHTWIGSSTVTVT